MLANQHRLPRLPLPALEATLERYLRAAAPLIPTPQLEATATVVRHELEDADGQLRTLQRQLEEAQQPKAWSLEILRADHQRRELPTSYTPRAAPVNGSPRTPPGW